MSAGESTPTFETLLAKLDTLDATFARVLTRARRRAFWGGWLCGVFGMVVERLILG